jgi:hypothetical protein
MFATKQLQIGAGVFPATSQRDNMINLQLKSRFTSFAIVVIAALTLSFLPHDPLD